MNKKKKEPGGSPVFLADFIRPVFLPHQRRDFLSRREQAPRPTLNYRRGVPMCAPVILADIIRPVFNGKGFIPHPSPAVTPSPLGRLFAADSCFYSINRLWVDKAKKRLFMRKNGMTDGFCERIFIHFLYIFLIYAENPA